MHEEPERARDADAAAGGAGAPPPPTEPNRAREGLTRTYARPELRVLWFADRCIHSAACIRALPAVFDPGRRPWIDVGAANADEICRAVELCPTGALHYERLDGGPQESVPDEITIRTERHGPHLLRGRVRIVGQDGAVLREDTRVALCRCGGSKHMPFCDNTHREIRFRDP